MFITEFVKYIFLIKKIYIYSLSILKYIIQIEIYIYFKQFKNTIWLFLHEFLLSNNQHPNQIVINSNKAQAKLPKAKLCLFRKCC
jgi:hypothetical protein